MEKELFLKAVSIKKNIREWEAILDSQEELLVKIKNDYGSCKVIFGRNPDQRIDFITKADIVNALERKINISKNMIRKYELEFERL